MSIELQISELNKLNDEYNTFSKDVNSLLKSTASFLNTNTSFFQTSKDDQLNDFLKITYGKEDDSGIATNVTNTTTQNTNKFRKFIEKLKELIRKIKNFIVEMWNKFKAWISNKFQIVNNKLNKVRNSKFVKVTGKVLSTIKFPRNMKYAVWEPGAAAMAVGVLEKLKPEAVINFIQSKDFSIDGWKNLFKQIGMDKVDAEDEVEVPQSTWTKLKNVLSIETLMSKLKNAGIDKGLDMIAKALHKKLDSAMSKVKGTDTSEAQNEVNNTRTILSDFKNNVLGKYQKLMNMFDVILSGTMKFFTQAEANEQNQTQQTNQNAIPANT